MKLRSAYTALVCIICTSTSHITETKPVKLTSTAIRLTDGIFIRWQEFALMITVRRDVMNILHGALFGDVKVGKYLLNDTAYTLSELVELEEEYKKNNNTKGLIRLADLLLEVKKNLQENLSKYIALARGAKDSMLILIDESCKKHGRKHSILHNWGATPEGQEEEQMEKDLANLTVCSEFCTDLINFLEDMLYSCEKAREQYKKEMAERLSNKA